MASKGPKSGKPAPITAKPKPAVAKVAKPPVAAPKAIAAPVVEEKKPAPKAPVVAEPIPAPVEAAPAMTAEPSLDVPSAVPAIEAEEKVAQETVTPVAEVAEVVAEVVKAAIETPAPPAAEPAPVFKKEFRMTVDPKTLFADFNDRTKAAMEKSAKTVEELNDFAKGNVEAIVESGKITAKGFEALSQEAAEYGRKSFETATAALKSLAAAKSPTDFFKLQSDFFRGAFDSYIAEASKTTEAVIKLAGEAAQPISSRVALAAEKAKIAA